jgi:F420-non-reducing hydrogenase small subunit
MSRPTLATLSLGGCEGCHVSLLDAHEGLLSLLERVDLVSTPYTGTEDLPASVDIVLIEGAVTTDADRRRAIQARERAGTVVALGSCAVLGGIGGLRNLHSADAVMTTAFGALAQKSDHLPRLEGQVRPLGEIIDVDVELTGCPTPTGHIVAALEAALTGHALQLPRRNLCDECHRKKVRLLEHTQEFVSDSVYALMELDHIDEDLCLLEQGLACMGPMTREGCGAVCTASNVPCRGCAGPSRLDFEQGGKAIDALAAVLPPGALMHMDDLIGLGYRFSMPVSIIPATYAQEEVPGDE